MVVGLKTELVIRIETLAMESVNVAEEYMGKFGWGPRGRHIGVSRMMGVSDKSMIATSKVVASVRPRGILSGFLVIVPFTGYAIFVPPVASKTSPFRIRLRIPETMWDDGALFSAYLRRDKRMILEDVLVWQGKPVWNTMGFSERWKLMGEFMESCSPDKALQGVSISVAVYMSTASLVEPDEHSVLEFVPQAPNQKRLIWMPSIEQKEQPKTTGLVAKRETAMGPDVFSVWRSEEKLGLALVKTLAISRALRMAEGATIPIEAVWNKGFDKWEIMKIIT
jgi:hypothetical protein